MFIVGDEAKLKWQKLKGKFKKLTRIRLEENGGPESCPAAHSWKFYNSMLFLKDCMRFEPTNLNTSMTTNNLSKGVSSRQPEENDDDFEEFNFDFFLPRSSDKEASKDTEVKSRKPGPRSSKRKIINTDEKNDRNQEPEEKKALTSPVLVHQDERKGNDDYHFLLSLMPYIQALDPVEKLELRSQIQNLVTASFKKEVNKCFRKYH